MQPKDHLVATAEIVNNNTQWKCLRCAENGCASNTCVWMPSSTKLQHAGNNAHSDNEDTRTCPAVFWSVLFWFKTNQSKFGRLAHLSLDGQNVISRGKTFCCCQWIFLTNFLQQVQTTRDQNAFILAGTDMWSNTHQQWKRIWRDVA